MRISTVLAFLAAALWVSGCALPAPERGARVNADPPFVSRAVFEVRLRHTDLIEVPVLFPSDADGRALIADAPRPALVFVQGGLVEEQRYEWIGEALAKRGYVVAFPEHPSDLAFFAVDNAEAARKLLVEPPEGSLLEGGVDPERIAVAGHSLGGVVAVKAALGGRFDALALLASYPDSADERAVGEWSIPSLSLEGEKDCSAKPSQVEQGFRALAEPKVLAVIEGATHYQFTDSQKEDDDRGCTPGITIDQAHARIAEALGLFLDAALSPKHETNAPAIDAIDGVEVKTP